MGREPFPRAGQRLNDAPARPVDPARRSAQAVSILGGIGYGPGYPSRWAGWSTQGPTRLTVDDDTIVLTPTAFLRKVYRMRVVRIPLDEIKTARMGPFGFTLRFGVPGDLTLDGTRFHGFLWDSAPLRPLIELLQSHGVAVESPSAARRWTTVLQDRVVGHRPGWIFRDRGYLGFVESFVVLGVVILVAGLTGSFSSEPHPLLIASGVVVALNVVASVVGHRLRRKAMRKD